MHARPERPEKEDEMKKKRVLMAVAVVAVVLVAIPVVHAQRPLRGGLDAPALFAAVERIDKLRTELDLSDAQVIALRHIAVGVREQNAPYREQIRESVREAGRVLFADPEAVEAARTILVQNAEAERQLKENVLEGVSEALKVLTPEQRRKLATMIAASRLGRG